MGFNSALKGLKVSDRFREKPDAKVRRYFTFSKLTDRRFGSNSLLDRSALPPCFKRIKV